MVIIPENIRNKLKTPLGKLYPSVSEVSELKTKHRIICIGDICTLNLLSIGIVPHLAVFDHLFMRNILDAEKVQILQKNFKNPKKYKNPAGTLSEAIIRDAAMLIKNGGAVLIDGEEDMTALAFIISADENDVIIYGQPNEGVVVVKPDKKLKEKVRDWLLETRN
ncbi:DUF359 domain-containing protein [Candidatus Micrarchaeota archaeon]|nr:DUF359 domain-containing protein [Candidatus Micrarchaeota archaeon]MBU1166452.1 DUF359 domain-containing protein [Candidatus Micrarchaeota archaeon]MBU1886541.1 DUF359 domain-containing protein [Candidatus Micrarchaeota archaeon]